MPRGAPKTQAERDSEWLIVQVRLKPETGDDLDNMRRDEPDLPSRAEMVRRIIEREAGRRAKRAK